MKKVEARIYKEVRNGAGKKEPEEEAKIFMRGSKECGKETNENKKEKSDDIDEKKEERGRRGKGKT